MCGGEMVDTDGKAKRRLGMQAQLDPVASVVRVNAANFKAPAAAPRLQVGAVEVDKKLVRVGYSGRNATSEADFANHVLGLCKFGASENTVIVEVNHKGERRYPSIKYGCSVNSLWLACEVIRLDRRY